MKTSECFTFGVMALGCYALIGDTYGYHYLILISCMLLAQHADLHWYGRYWVGYFLLNLVLIAVLQGVDYRPIGGLGYMPLWIDSVVYSLADLLMVFLFVVAVRRNYLRTKASNVVIGVFFSANLFAHAYTAYMSGVMNDETLASVYDFYLYTAFYAVLTLVFVIGLWAHVGTSSFNLRDSLSRWSRNLTSRQSR